MTRRRLGAAGLVLTALVLLAGCGGSSAPPAASSLPSIALPSGDDGSDGNGGFASSKQLEATLPTNVNGVMLTTGSINVLQLYTTGNTALNTLTVFSAGLGTNPAQVAVAAAADPDGKIQIIGAQFQGQTSAAIQAEVEKVAKQTDPNVVLASVTIGGKPVTTATFPNDHDGPTYTYVTGDTLYILQSADPALIEAALKQLP